MPQDYYTLNPNDAPHRVSLLSSVATCIARTPDNANEQCMAGAWVAGWGAHSSTILTPSGHYTLVVSDQDGRVSLFYTPHGSRVATEFDVEALFETAE